MKRDKIALSVPASKSILGRALVLAAFLGGTEIECGAFGQDTEDLIGALSCLGCNVRRAAHRLIADGKPAYSAAINVGSAGTAARFLTAILAVRGGEYEMSASPQMTARPMSILSRLEEQGVKIRYLGEYAHFPFRMSSQGIFSRTIRVDTDESTQYATGLMLAAACSSPLKLELTGRRRDGGYLALTLSLLRAFGAEVVREGDLIEISPSSAAPTQFSVEPDVSAACYFYALSLLTGANVLVRGVHSDSLQPDLNFLRLLEERGVLRRESDDGICMDGAHAGKFAGFDLDMRGFSDQMLTVCALAPFAETPTHIRGIGHTRKQESDRIRAALSALSALGVSAEAGEDGITVYPATVSGGTVDPMDDHRVAMAFSLVGLKCGNVKILNPQCTKKTFPNFFSILDSFTE